ncbi:MAG: hypothetical protein WCE63_05555 [Acidobacteriaceae bacterium]
MNREVNREKFRQDAMAAWNHYQTTGQHITAEEADKWLAMLEAGKNAPDLPQIGLTDDVAKKVCHS